jgi:hypothetical protein
VEPRRFEPLTSAVQRRHDTLPDLSRVCKRPANKRISTLWLFLIFQKIYSGCCTVAAQAPPFGQAHGICTRLHTYAALLPVVIEGTETDALEHRGGALTN